MTIKIIHNFLSPEQSDKIISFIDDYQDSFAHYERSRRFLLRFGHDDEIPNQSVEDMSIIATIKDDLANISKKVSSLINDNVYLTSWFLSKQYPTGKLFPHVDGMDGGPNSQLEYTAMLYLNSLNDNGTIFFSDAGFGITPRAGDLVIFKSKKDVHEVLEVKENRYSINLWFTKDKNFEFTGLNQL
jgi:hypothetical protein